MREQDIVAHTWNLSIQEAEAESQFEVSLDYTMKFV